MATEILKAIGFILLGAALAVGIFCLSVAIGCAVNGISFGVQIAEWFGESSSVIETVNAAAAIRL